jgi:hypothetical protein
VFVSYDLAMAHAVNCDPITVAARFQSQASLHGIYGGHIGTGAGLFSCTLVIPFHFLRTDVAYLFIGCGHHIIIAAVDIAVK